MTDRFYYGGGIRVRSNGNWGILSEKQTPAGVGCDMLDGHVESLGTPEKGDIGLC